MEWNGTLPNVKRCNLIYSPVQWEISNPHTVHTSNQSSRTAHIQSYHTVRCENQYFDSRACILLIYLSPYRPMLFIPIWAKLIGCPVKFGEKTDRIGVASTHKSEGTQTYGYMIYTPK